MFTIKQNWRDIKPPVGSQLNYGHPLSQGLVGCWLMNEGGGNKISNSLQINYGGIASWERWSKGIGLSTTSSDLLYNSRSFYDCDPRISIIYGMQSTAHRLLLQKKMDAGDYRGWLLDNYYERPRFKYTDSATDEIFDTGSDSYKANDGLYHVWAVTAIRDGASNWYWYRDGKKIATHTSVRTGSTVNPNPLNLSCSGLIVYFVYLYNRVLSPSEIQSLYIDPYQFIQPIRRRFFSIPASGTTSAPQATSLISSRHLQLLGVG